MIELHIHNDNKENMEGKHMYNQQPSMNIFPYNASNATAYNGIPYNGASYNGTSYNAPAPMPYNALAPASATSGYTVIEQPNPSQYDRYGSKIELTTIVKKKGSFSTMLSEIAGMKLSSFFSIFFANML